MLVQCWENAAPVELRPLCNSTSGGENEEGIKWKEQSNVNVNKILTCLQMQHTTLAAILKILSWDITIATWDGTDGISFQLLPRTGRDYLLRYDYLAFKRALRHLHFDETFLKRTLSGRYPVLLLSPHPDSILRKYKMNPETIKQLNIVILGIAFMFLFTAFQTCGNIAQTVITNLNHTDFHGSGYTSMAVIYGVFSASNLISPSVVAVVGPQFSMFFGGIFYSIYIGMFIQPSTGTFYAASVFLGIAAAILWTAQGNCLTINSNANTIGRNSGIFWALLQFSLFFGNLYIYFAWQGKTYISESDRRTVFIALTVISLVGAVLFFLIRTVNESNLEEAEVSASVDPIEHTSGRSPVTRAVDAFKRSISLCWTKEILLLSITTAYTGLELTFFTGVYGTCIGAVNKFGTEEKSLIGLSGIFIGIGEILGGGIFGLLSKNNRFGRNPVVMLGIVVHFLAFYLIFFNLPNDAPIASMSGTDSIAYMEPSKEVAIFCSFLLGLGDSCFNTQLLSILGYLYSEDSAPAFAVFKFIQSVSAAIAFFYSNYLFLQWQLLIMVIVGFFGTISFFTVEWAAPAFVAKNTEYSSI